MFNDELFKRINFINMSESSIEAYNSFLNKVLRNAPQISERFKNINHLNRCFALDSYQKEF